VYILIYLRYGNNCSDVGTEQMLEHYLYISLPHCPMHMTVTVGISQNIASVLSSQWSCDKVQCE